MQIFLGIMMFIFYVNLYTEKSKEKAYMYSWLLIADIIALVFLSLAR